MNISVGTTIPNINIPNKPYVLALGVPRDAYIEQTKDVIKVDGEAIKKYLDAKQNTFMLSPTEFEHVISREKASTTIMINIDIFRSLCDFIEICPTVDKLTGIRFLRGLNQFGLYESKTVYESAYEFVKLNSEIYKKNLEAYEQKIKVKQFNVFDQFYLAAALAENNNPLLFKYRKLIQKCTNNHARSYKEACKILYDKYMDHMDLPLPGDEFANVVNTLLTGHRGY